MQEKQIEKLNKLLELMQNDTVTPKVLEEFLVLVLSTIQKSKEGFESLSAENLAKIKGALDYIQSEHEQIISRVDAKNTSTWTRFEGKLQEVTKLLAEIKQIKATPGKDADEEKIVAEVLSKIPVHECKVVECEHEEELGEDIVEKINELPTDDDRLKIDAIHIKNLPELTKTYGSNISKAIYQLSDVVLTNLANNDILKWDDTNKYWVNGTGGSGSGWSLTGNAGTTAGTNFIGTTDAIDFVVKTNNTERMRVTSAGNYQFTGSSIIVTGGSQWDWWGDGSTTYVTMGSINADSYFRLRSGTGGVTLYSPSHVAIEAGAPLRFYNAGDSHYTALKAGNPASDTTYTLPITLPSSSGQALVATTGGVMSWTSISGSTTTFSVTQTTHGFSVGDIIKSAGTANAYAKAQANSSANAEVVGIVTVVTDANNFTYTTEGVITTGVPVATAGTTYFLSPSSAGAMTATEPTTVGQVSKPLLIVLESGAKAVFAFSIRGEVIGTVAGLAGSTGITVDGGGGVITTGVKGYISIPYSGTITGWTIFSDISGSCVIDTWKDTYANFPPTVADTIWGGSKPTLSSAQKNQATGLSIAVTQGDVFAYNVDSATTVTRVNLTINITKS